MSRLKAQKQGYHMGLWFRFSAGAACFIDNNVCWTHEDILLCWWSFFYSQMVSTPACWKDLTMIRVPQGTQAGMLRRWWTHGECKSVRFHGLYCFREEKNKKNTRLCLRLFSVFANIYNPYNIKMMPSLEIYSPLSLGGTLFSECDLHARA